VIWLVGLPDGGGGGGCCVLASTSDVRWWMRHRPVAGWLSACHLCVERLWVSPPNDVVSMMTAARVRACVCVPAMVAAAVVGVRRRYGRVSSLSWLFCLSEFTPTLSRALLLS
jgi:hypothetical protein